MSGMSHTGPSFSGAPEPLKPDTGGLRANLDQWILWVKEYIETGGDIPSVLDLARQAINNSNGKELLFAAVPDGVSPESLEDCWGNRLAETPSNLAVRAGVLVCGWWKRASLEAELDDWSASGEEAFIREGIEAQCLRVGKTLGFLVRFLPPEDCPGTWPDLRWEILNSYLVEDWDRATRLYNRAEDLQLQSAGEIAALRGQFRFLAEFGSRIQENVRRLLKRADIRLALNTLFCELRIYGRDGSDELDQLKALLLFENGMCDGDRELVLNDSSKSILLDAANDLQKAFLSPSGLPYPYRAVLGRCHYCTGRFHDAAEQYGTLLQGQGQSGQPNAGRRLFASLSLSYQQAGETERAKEILERWAREFPDEKGVYLQLAELEAQGTNYHRIAEYLRKEIEKNPAVEEDWKLSALLALGATHDTSKTLDVLRDTPLWQPLYSVLAEYWPPFPGLAENAKDEWACGIAFIYLSALPESMRLRKAAESCARAVEIELRDRIFRPYKQHVNERPSLKSMAEQELRERTSGKFCEFLVRDGSVTLGEMARILGRRGGVAEPIFRDFQAWLSGSQRRLMQSLQQLDPILAFRSPAVHEGLTKTNPMEVIRSCKIVMEALK
jgi:tetratricopeptide (TPR) repeat protein